MANVASESTALKRLDRYDWLLHGIETLRFDGVEAVRVEPMARSLGVTKGSFYWHFKDREDFLDRLLEYWETESTDNIEGHVSSASGDPRDKLLAVLEYITKEEINRYDASVRAWALYDERAAGVVRRVDQKRLAYVRDLFREMGQSDEQAEVRGRMSYFYLVGEHTAFTETLPREKRLELVRLRYELLVGC